MKFVNQIKLLVIAVLITACITRTEKKKSKTKNDMARQFTVKIFVDPDTNASAQASIGTIDAKTIKVPKNEEVRALNIKFTTINNDLKSLLTESNGNYYLSYRRLNSDFTVVPVNSAGRTISVQIQKTNAEFHILKFQFEYDPEWEVITEAEVLDVVSWLNRNRVDRRNAITALKTLALQYASEYKTQTENLAASSKGAAAIDAQIATTTKLAESKEAELKQASDNLAEIEKKILAANTNIDRISGLLSNSKKSIDHIDSQISLKTQSINELTTKLSSGKVSAQSFKTTQDNNEASFKNAIGTLKTEAPSSSTTLDTAFTVLKDSGSKKVEELLRQVFPK